MSFAEIIASFKLEKEPDSEVVLSGVIPAEAVANYRDAALKHLASHLELPGFRKGKVPMETALKHAGDVRVLEESVEMFMRDFYPELVLGKKIDAVGRPDIQVTKLAPGNPVEVRIRTAVYPIIEVPADWRELAAKVPNAEMREVSEDEVAQTLESIRHNRAAKPEAELATGQKEAPALPELNDEFARSVGAFKDLEDLKAQIRKGIGEEKARRGKEERRGKIIEALLERTKTEMPRIFIESELEKIIGQMKEDIIRMGMQFPDYLKRLNKTEEDLRKEFRSQAEKRARLQLLLNKLAEDEKIVADSEAVEAELKHARQLFPEADPERVRIHVETVLRNEKVLKLLEEQ